MGIDWKVICAGCGECCGPVPFDAEFLVKNGGKFQETPLFIQEIKGKQVPVTVSLSCVFLHRTSKQCLIYHERPEVCQLQGTIPQLPCPRNQELLDEETTKPTNPS